MLRITRRRLLIGSALGVTGYALGTWLGGRPAPVWTDEPYLVRHLAPPPTEGSLTTLTLQPDATDGKDNGILSSFTGINTNYGTSTSLDAIVDGNGDLRRGLLQFDLSTIPLGSTVSSATLTIYRRALSTAHQMDVHRITQGWTEAGSTWNRFMTSLNWDTAGGDYHATPAASATPTGSESDGDPLAFDVTTLVASWVSGTYPNAGFLIKKATETGANTGFASWSSDKADQPTWRPKLVVEYTAASSAGDRIAGSGGWCWFGDPRAVYYNGVTYIGYINSMGDIVVRPFTNASGTLGDEFKLSTVLEQDDHDNPAILIRDSDKKILAWYSKHDGTTIYQRLSTNTEDVSAWGAEGSLDASLGGNRYTYPTPIQLTGEANDPIYLFWRGRATDSPSADPHWAFGKSEDGAATWSAQTVLHDLTYGKICRNGTARIDFAACYSPNDVSQPSYGIHHFYYQGGNYYQTDGTLIGDSAALPLDETDMTQVYDGSTNKAWIWDIAAEPATGYPVITFVKFVTTTSDHRYMYARWNGSSWDVNEIVAEGGIFTQDAAYATYSGGIVIDHSDTDVVYLSRVQGSNHELYQYTTGDGGGTWASVAITAGSGWDNVRPFVVRDWAAGCRVLWLAGAYQDYWTYTMEIQGAETSTVPSSFVPAVMRHFFIPSQTPSQLGGRNG